MIYRVIYLYNLYPFQIYRLSCFQKKYIYILQIVVQSTNIYTSSLLTLFDKPGHVKVERVDYETEYIKESESFPGHGDMLLVAAGGSIDNVVISQDIWRCVWVWVIFVGRVRVVKKCFFLYILGFW